jgi:two-component system response regulator AtoC
VGEAQSRRVDVRLLAATARDLEREVAGSRFREDLYYRLNVVRIHLPPLRERPEDIEPLAAQFLKRAEQRYGRRLSLAPEGLAALTRRPWPGNVRELENVIERAAVLSPDGVLRIEPTAPERSPESEPSELAGNQVLLLRHAVAQAERQAIQLALHAASGNRAAAAKLLGISPRNLFYKLKKLGLE